MSDLFKNIKERRSFRTFDGNPLSKEDEEKLMNFAAGAENPFGVKIEFKMLDADEYGLTSPVLAGATKYVGAKVVPGPDSDLAYGYAFESFVLYAQSLGIGTVWIAGTMNRDAFEKAMDLTGSEVMPCMTPVGYPAKRMAAREVLMRKGVKADSRKDASELFFDGDFGTPLKTEDKAVADALEMLRWAPSAVNRQPWRVVFKDGKYHFYEKQDKGYAHEFFDLQMIDVGIGLSHFVLALKEAGLAPVIEKADPMIATAPNVRYAVTVSF